MASHLLAQVQAGDLEICGYSVAGEETVIGMPQLDVCFDIGKSPDQLISINNVLLTHGHMDHSAGLAYYLSHRKFIGLPPGTVLTPPNLVPHIEQILEAWGRLDGNSIPVNLVPVTPGFEYRLKTNLIVRVFATRHTRQAVGFSVIETRKKLKQEYAGLSGAEIVKLKREGATVENPVEIPVVSYLGDTSYMEFDNNEDIAKSKILIAECTFFEDEHLVRADAGRHMHIDEFAPLLERMQNEVILITHLTQRTGIAEIKRMLKEKLSEQTYKKIIILMDRKNRPRNA